jgi:hypothetical protein
MKDWILVIADHPIASIFLAIVLGAGIDGITDWIRAWRGTECHRLHQDEDETKGEE